MAAGNTIRRGLDHTASQAPDNQPLNPQNQEPQASAAMTASQPSQPAQTQPQPLMQCCGKQNIRDCDCTVPHGPCLVPEYVFTHYHRECLCYSCEWIREAKEQNIPDRIPPQSGLTVANPTYCGNRMDHLPETNGFCTNLELVHPILLEESPQRWGWVFHSGNQTQLPFLASDSDCPDAVRVTLGSHGKWKALKADGTSYALGYDMRPTENELYRDYGYAPECSPYGPNGESESRFTPRKVNPAGYKPRLPRIRSRQHAAAEHNTTLFIGGINEDVSNQDLRELFNCFGQISYLNRPHQTSAFIQFAQRRDALMAMRQMQGVPIYKWRLRISWGDPKPKAQRDFGTKNGRLPFKGYKHPQQLQQQHQSQGVPQHGPQNVLPQQRDQYQGTNNMQAPWNQQQHYQTAPMDYAPVQNIVWGRVQDHPSAEPELPQTGHSSRPFRLNPDAACWKGNMYGKGPVVVSSDMVPNPYRQLWPFNDKSPGDGNQPEGDAKT